MERALLTLMGGYFFYIILLGFYTFYARFTAVRQKRMSGQYFKTYQGEVPNDVLAVGNHFNNQFQIPIMFFIAGVAAIQVKAASPWFFATSLFFVCSRMAHSYVHLTNNKVLLRAAFYFMGCLSVLALWGIILASMYSSAPNF